MFNQSLEQVSLPSSLQGLEFGEMFNQNLEGVALPNSLQSLKFGGRFRQNLARINLPGNLQNLTLGSGLNQSLEGVTLPRNLRSLNFGDKFNQSLDRVSLPHSLESLTFGFWFNQNLDRATLPSRLQSLKFGVMFNQSLEHTTLPRGLQSLTFGHDFNQSLDRVNLPKNLQSLAFGALDALKKYAELIFFWWFGTFGLIFHFIYGIIMDNHPNCYSPIIIFQRARASSTINQWCFFLMKNAMDFRWFGQSTTPPTEYLWESPKVRISTTALKARASPTCEAWRWVRGSNFPPSDKNLTWRSSVHVDCREIFAYLIAQWAHHV